MQDGWFDQAASERLFSTLPYAVFAAPCAIVVIWMIWRVMAWCLFRAWSSVYYLCRERTIAVFTE